jgi:hypothetical protein
LGSFGAARDPLEISSIADPMRGPADNLPGSGAGLLGSRGREDPAQPVINTTAATTATTVLVRIVIPLVTEQ